MMIRLLFTAIFALIAGMTGNAYAQAPRAQIRPASAAAARVDDALKLKSTAALVIDQDTDEVLFEKNANAVQAIASITKLMTAMITVDANLPMDEELTVTREDRTVGRLQSLLQPGVAMARGQALQLALMSSENNAAQLLARSYPGGVAAFVEAMNAKAQLLGMHESHFVDPTGLSPDNRATPADLARLVKAAYDYPLIREYSTQTDLWVPIRKHMVRYQNTNRLTSSPDWQIGLQKTGFIAAAGRCLVMQAVIGGQRVVMVLLDSVGKYSRIGDAQRIRQWLQARKPVRSEPLALNDAAPASER